PRSGRALCGIEAARVLEHLQEDLLRCVLGEGSRARERIGEPVHVVAPSAIELDEGGLATGRRFHEKRRVSRFLRRCLTGHRWSFALLFAPAARKVPAAQRPVDIGAASQPPSRVRCSRMIVTNVGRAALGLLLAGLACAQAVGAEPSIQVVDAWARATPPGVENGAVYCKIQNQGAADR